MVAIYLLDKRYEDAVYLQDKKNNILKFKNDNDAFNYLHCRIKFNDEKHLEDFGLFLDRGIKWVTNMNLKEKFLLTR